MVFATTNLAAVRLADEIGANRAIAAAATAACAFALAALLVHAARTSLVSVVLFGVLIAASWLGEATYQTRRRLHGLGEGGRG